MSGTFLGDAAAIAAAQEKVAKQTAVAPSGAADAELVEAVDAVLPLEVATDEVEA